MKTRFSLVLAVLLAGCTSTPKHSIAPYPEAADSETNVLKLARATIVAMCNEIQNDPARRQAVANAFSIAVDSENRILGFRLLTEAEPDLSAKLGFHDEDILLRVNFIRVTTKHRLEQFANDFITDRANNFVVELDRKGKRIKQLYHFR